MTKQLRTRKNKQKKITPQSRFNDALVKYQRIQKQNERFRDDLDTLVARVTPQIEAAENKRLQALTVLNHRLIPFMSKKTLPEYLRDELYEWIQENMEQIALNPFTQKDALDTLYEALDEHMDALQRTKSEKFLNKLRKQGHSEEELEEASRLVDAMHNSESFEEFMASCENIFGEDDNPEQETNSSDELDKQNVTEDMFGPDESLFGNDTDFNEYINSEYEDAFFEETEAEKRQQRQLTQLLKKSSITKLFRRIAKAIHPDLETDPALKKQKHQKMSQLIIARDEKDIALILQLYNEIIGDLPDEFSTDDYQALTKLLNHKIEELRDNKNAILAEKPQYGPYYEWFYAKNSHQEKQNISDFKAQLSRLSTNYILIASEITSIKSLRPFLEERQHQSLMNRFSQNFGDIPFWN